MPPTFPNDPDAVRLLVQESERINAIGNHWLSAKVPNAIAAQHALQMGWAFAVAAAWLRCKLRGEFNAAKGHAHSPQHITTTTA